MRLASICFLLTLAAGCGDDGGGEEPYDTFQLCYDDHHTTESLPVKEAIVVCCLEHPIGGVVPVCGDTATACQTYLGANLGASSATTTEVMEACAEYITQKGM